MAQNAESQDLSPAYGPEKDAWKSEGNYFTIEELKALERWEVTIQRAPDVISSAD